MGGRGSKGSHTRQPERLGTYRLFRRIGRGGMAEVYVARKDDDLVDRELVVKRMLPHLAGDERFVRMFLREARIAMQLSHPNIVEMYEVGVDNGEYFIAMELLEGLAARDLANRVWSAGEGLPLELVARMVCDAALGLHYAHTLTGADGAVLPPYVGGGGGGGGADVSTAGQVGFRGRLGGAGGGGSNGANSGGAGGGGGTAGTPGGPGDEGSDDAGGGSGGGDGFYELR